MIVTDREFCMAWYQPSGGGFLLWRAHHFRLIDMNRRIGILRRTFLSPEPCRMKYLFVSFILQSCLA